MKITKKNKYSIIFFAVGFLTVFFLKPSKVDAAVCVCNYRNCHRLTTCGTGSEWNYVNYPNQGSCTDSTPNCQYGLYFQTGHKVYPTCGDCPMGYGESTGLNDGSAVHTSYCVESCTGGACKDTCHVDSWFWANNGTWQPRCRGICCGNSSCKKYKSRGVKGCKCKRNNVNPPPTPPPPPDSCTVTLGLSPTPVDMGSNTAMFANVVPTIGTVDEVRFSSDNDSVATVTSPAASSPYETQATGVSVGSATVTADVIMGGAVTCTDDAVVDVSGPDAWFQVEDGDVMTSGDVNSSIPSTCVTPSCVNEFDLEGAGGYPGVVIFGGSATFIPGGITSATSWEADTQTSYRKIYDYSFFDRLIGSDVVLTEIDSPSVNGGYFASGGSPARGYVWYHFDGSALGDLTINSNVNLPSDRKVILLVEGADLHIQGQININLGQGFFMAIVGKDSGGSRGNIIVDPSVSHPNQPELEGIFLTEGQFQTGAGTEQLHIRGMVAAYDGIVLQRDLTDNSETPAELFEYAPDMVLTFPRDLTSAAIRWKEVAP